MEKYYNERILLTFVTEKFMKINKEQMTLVTDCFSRCMMVGNKNQTNKQTDKAREVKDYRKADSQRYI